MSRSVTQTLAEQAPVLSAEERSFLLHVSRRALVRYFANGGLDVPQTSTPALLEPRRLLLRYGAATVVNCAAVVVNAWPAGRSLTPWSK